MTLPFTRTSLLSLYLHHCPTVASAEGRDLYHHHLWSNPDGRLQNYRFSNIWFLHYIIACRTLESAQKLAEGFKNTTAIALDVNDADALDKALEQVDLAISLIPYTFHALVIKSAIRTKKHVVTTSYVSPAMLELDEECKKAGITVMNEIGLDPVCHSRTGNICALAYIHD